MFISWCQSVLLLINTGCDWGRWPVWVPGPLYTPCPDKKRCHWYFHNNFYKYARIFMIFGTQLCKWTLIILVNLLRCVPCTSLTWWRNVDVNEIMPFTVHVTVTNHHAAVRDAIFYPSRDVATATHHPIRQIWIRWTTASGVFFKRGSTVLGFMMWRSWKNVGWASGGCWTTPSSPQRWRSRLNACVCVNGGHCEHKFWAWLSAVFCLFHRYWFP